MQSAKCGREYAEKMWGRVMRNLRGYIPPDVEIYGRAFIGIFAEMPEACAEYWTRRIVRRHRLPPRCELLWMLGNAPQIMDKLESGQ